MEIGCSLHRLVRRFALSKVSDVQKRALKLIHINCPPTVGIPKESLGIGGVGGKGSGAAQGTRIRDLIAN